MELFNGLHQITTQPKTDLQIHEVNEVSGFLFFVFFWGWWGVAGWGGVGGVPSPPPHIYCYSSSETSVFRQGLQLHNKEMEVSRSQDKAFVAVQAELHVLMFAVLSHRRSPASDGSAPRAAAGLIPSRGLSDIWNTGLLLLCCTCRRIR